MLPLTATYYDPQQKLWSGPVKKDLYNENITLGEVIFLELSKHPQKLIQINDSTNEEMKAEEFLDHVMALSKNLLKLGLKVGDVVGMYANNATHTATVMVAAYLCGTPVNALYPGFDKDSAELIYKVTRPKIIFCDVENYEIAAKVNQDLQLNAPIFIMNGEVKGVSSILSLVKPNIKFRNEPFVYPCVNLKGDDTAVILCSSGTTGIPKGVLCSHRALLNEKIHFNLKSDSVVCTFSTMYWASGLWNMNASLITCCLRIITDKSFTAEYFLQLIERHRITNMLTNGNHMVELIMYDDVSKIQKCLASLDTLTLGGAKVLLTVQESLADILKVNDKRPGFGVAYGMSELSGILSFNSDFPYERKLGTEGKLTANKKVRIINKKGEFLGPNEHGEIIIKTPYKWFGYYRNEEASKKAYIDNWLHSGDIGFFDDEGFLHVCARDNDVFKARNFQIYPPLIEDVVMEVAGVLEACVFGIPDLMASHLITCAVVRTADDIGRKLTAKEIISHVEKKMGNMYHLSGGVYFLDAIPKTGSGKVQRAKVVDIVLKIKDKQM
ncbi:luciferin 4-monooxygenase-like [Lucilia sericata]|uniref:luciferin 4-monooxygenase-like n=1 Tax=Lucilia sericata TaxID=13632 RepID=UPI0018A7EAB3|nr:luciferin 4-monooxygenase-like [Lucilia sericata]